MGQTQSLFTEVEIEAPPQDVRSVFMDFPRYKEWSKWTFEPLDATKTPAELKADDDSLKVNLKGMAFQPVVKENSTESFAWEGSLYGLLVGKHEFHWTPSTKTPGGTTMIQSENFRGPLAFMFGQGWSARQSTLDNWNGFFADLKKEVEASSTKT